MSLGVGLTRPAFTQTLRNTPGFVAHSAQQAVYDIVRDPAALKKEGFMIATIIQSCIRGVLGWVNEHFTKDPEQKELRFREAIRTTLREIGGLTLNFGVLRLMEKWTNKVLDLLQGGSHWKPTTPKGLARLSRDLKSMRQAILHGQPLPKLVPTTLETIEKLPTYTFDMNSPLGRWFTQSTQSGLFKGKDPRALMHFTRNWLPITLGSMASVVLSGFWLEWLTLHKSEQIVSFSTKQVSKAKLKKHPHTKGYNVNEFVSGVLEERWRREQVETPESSSTWFGKQHKTS